LADAASNRLFIADSNHNRVVVATLDGTLVSVIGSGEIGAANGTYEQCSFFRPQGLALDRDVLYVADTENHLLRRVDLAKKRVTTLAGNGKRGEGRSLNRQPARQTGLNSPWDLWLHGGKLYVAMAGPHQIWMYDPSGEAIRVYAGSGREDIVDGALARACLAQPSGLASDGRWLFVADAEVSAIRAVSLDSNGGVRTLVGAGLFEFGDRDGAAEQVRLQHPLGVAFHAGLLYVADTYNNKVKVIDPSQRACRTLLGDGRPGSSDSPPRFDEPSGLSVAAGRLYIADTNNHLIRVADLNTGAVSTLTIRGLEPPKPAPVPLSQSFPNATKLTLPPQSLKAGTDVSVTIAISLGFGWELNPDAPMTYSIEAIDAKGLVSADSIGKSQPVKPPSTLVRFSFKTTAQEGNGVLRIGTTYYPCQKSKGGLCEVRSVVWEVPVTIAASATGTQLGLETPDQLATPESDADATKAAANRGKTR
jgi:hypothetical protein